MLVDQYYAWDANEAKIVGNCPWLLKFEGRITAIYRERQFWNNVAKRFDTEVTKVRD